ncbi:MAG: 5-nucleotidase/2,3-cyclic phosphodiesterase [Microbacterium sp.]|jgi:hypothetical protein|nr:5-nucleotidase/2,3-cyclic phosphodiesterase [Microbacterium sp.]
MNAAPALTVTERLDDYLRRRARSGLPLTPGETVTVAVGVLRGCHDAADRARGAAWGLTARGRPLLVDAPDGDDALGATAIVLAQLAPLTASDGRDLIERARDAILTQPPRIWEQWERRLFAWADPLPLVLGPLAPRDDSGSAEPTSAAQTSPFLALVDADLASMASEAIRGLVTGWRTWRHRRALVFGVVAAGVAVVLAMALPAGERGTASADDRGSKTPAPAAPSTPSASPTAPHPGDRTPPPSPESLASEAPAPDAEAPGADTSPAPPTDDVVAAAESLLTAWAACADDASCEQALREGRAEPGEAPPRDPREANVSLVDDFGGLAVVRLDDGAAPQYVTIVRAKDRWLIRAVRTVADQPS